MMPTVASALGAARSAFEAIGIPAPALDAEALMMHVLQVSRTALVADSSRVLSADESAAFDACMSRRLTREPLHYITGWVEFYELSLAVSRDVLVPRVETELLVDQALFFAPYGATCLDICTGSGCIPVALRYNRPDIIMRAGDISEAALAVAARNAERILGPGVVDFRRGDLFEPFAGELFGLITANPPYIGRDESPSLQAELSFEPADALFSDEDGMWHVRRILESAGDYLRPGGVLLLEISALRKDAVLALADANGWRAVVTDDFAGLPRIVRLTGRSSGDGDQT
jgi:release factor glutamine methyltransferase